MNVTFSPVDAVSVEDLYARWEAGNWSATAIDFSDDRVEWTERLTEFQRRAALWHYSMFLHGEDAVADNLSPFIDAAPREEQKYFLATQQADEARHAVFFARFMREVVGIDGDTARALGATRPQLSWGFRRVFELLDRVVTELRRDRSAPQLARAVTLYHLIVEGVLAQPGQHFIESYLTRHDVLPGLREGMQHVALDEQRHIAFGVKLLSELLRESPECEDAVEDLLREVVPLTATVFAPPGGDERYVECFGSQLDELYEDGARAMESRLRACGLDVERLRIGIPFDLPPGERARRGLVMLRAGYIGPAPTHLVPSAEATEILFDSIRRQVDPEAARQAVTTIQWEFSDAERRHLRVGDGVADVRRGQADRVDVVVRCRLGEWVDIAAGRSPIWRSLVKRRITVRGRPTALLRVSRQFA